MGIFDKLFGKKNIKNKQKMKAGNNKDALCQPKLSGAAEVFQKPTQEQMDILRYLCTCGKFDRSKMENYISMAEKVGMQYSPQEKEQMLNAIAFFAPKLQSDGTVLDDFNQLRVEFVVSHAKAVSQSIQLIKQLPPESATVAFLQNVTDEMNDLTKKLKIT